MNEVKKEELIYHKFKVLKYLIILLFLSIPFQGLLSQDQDFRGWYSVSYDNELFNLFDFSISPQLRMKENHSQLDSWIVDAEMDYEVIDDVEVGSRYRYKMEADNGLFKDRIHRIGFYGKYSYRLKPFDLYYRTIYQWEFENINSSVDGRMPEEVWRHKVQAKYDRNKIDYKPFISFEYYDVVRPMEDTNKHKMRFKGGVEYKINKHYSVSLGYIYQKELNQPNPSIDHIIALGLSID